MLLHLSIWIASLYYGASTMTGPITKQIYCNCPQSIKADRYYKLNRVHVTSVLNHHLNQWQLINELQPFSLNWLFSSSSVAILQCFSAAT